MLNRTRFTPTRRLRMKKLLHQRPLPLSSAMDSRQARNAIARRLAAELRREAENGKSQRNQTLCTLSIRPRPSRRPATTTLNGAAKAKVKAKLKAKAGLRARE